VEWICETYPVDQLVQDQIDFFTEQFEMVVDDLYALPADNPVVAEGSGLLPDCVSRVADRQKGIWMVSTQGFEQEMRPFVGQKSEPWFEKLTEWSAKRREHTVTRAEQLGLKIVETDGSRTTADTIELVKTHFGLR